MQDREVSRPLPGNLERAGLLEIGGALPQAALMTLATRRCSSGPLNFAARMPRRRTRRKASNATEDTVMRPSNGPERRGWSSTERRVCARELRLAVVRDGAGAVSGGPVWRLRAGAWRGRSQPVRRRTAARSSGGRSSPASSRPGSSSAWVVRARNDRPMVTVCRGRRMISMRSPALISPGTTTRR